GGTYGDGVQIRDRIRKQAAFQSGVDRFDLDLGAKKAAVALFKYFPDPGVLFVAPARIFSAVFSGEAEAFGKGAETFFHILLKRGYRRAGGKYNGQLLFPCTGDTHV